MITNEELVNEIQAGHQELMAQLWEQVKRFIMKQANRRMMGYENHTFNGVMVEDLISCGYFALVDAVNSYDETKGRSFIGWLNFYLKKSWGYELGTIRKDNPLNDALSISYVYGKGQEEYTFADIIEDPGAQDDFNKILDQARDDDRRSFIQEAMQTLTDHEREIVNAVIAADFNRAEASRQLNISRERANEMFNRSCRKLREYIVRHKERAAEVDIITAKAGRHTSYQAWKNAQCTSTTEDLALQLVELAEFKNKIMKRLAEEKQMRESIAL